jgi:hypothetical protein
MRGKLVVADRHCGYSGLIYSGRDVGHFNTFFVFSQFAVDDNVEIQSRHEGHLRFSVTYQSAGKAGRSHRSPQAVILPVLIGIVGICQMVDRRGQHSIRLNAIIFDLGTWIIYASLSVTDGIRTPPAHDEPMAQWRRKYVATKYSAGFVRPRVN